MIQENPLLEIMLYDTVTIKPTDPKKRAVSGWLPVPGARRTQRDGIIIVLQLDKSYSLSGKVPVTREVYLPQATRGVDGFGRVIVNVPRRTVIPQFGDVEIEVMPYTTSTTNESIHL